MTLTRSSAWWVCWGCSCVLSSGSGTGGSHRRDGGLSPQGWGDLTAGMGGLTTGMGALTTGVGGSHRRGGGFSPQGWGVTPQGWGALTAAMGVVRSCRALPVSPWPVSPWPGPDATQPGLLSVPMVGRHPQLQHLHVQERFVFALGLSSQHVTWDPGVLHRWSLVLRLRCCLLSSPHLFTLE